MTTPATDKPKPSTDVAVRDPELDRYARLGRWLALSESRSDDPAAKGAAAALRFYYARELGLPPMAAAELSVIDGKLVVSAQLYRGLAESAGYRIERTELDDTHCTATLFKGETRIGDATFTMEDAKRAGLIRDRSAWKTYPQRMLWARASAFVIRDYASHVAVGIITREELEVGTIDGEAIELHDEPVDETQASEDDPLQREPDLDEQARWEAEQALAAEAAEAADADPDPEPAADEGAKPEDPASAEGEA